MVGIYITSFLLLVFGTFNLLGIRNDLIDNHFLLVGLGVIVFFLARFVGIQFFRQNARFFYWLFVGLLIFTYVVGIEVKGSQRWIDLYFIRFQPSEFFKVFFIIFLADLYSRHRKFDNDTNLFFVSIFFFAIPALIIFIQPDLGTAMVYVFVFISMTLFSGLSRRYILYFLSVGVLTMPIMWLFLHDYQRNRILAFVNPQLNQESTAYNMTQAIITSGSGQLTGRGLGMGKQSTLYFLPEYHTDFAYSSLVEQFGFIGGGLVIILYIVLAVFLILKIVNLYSKNDEKYRFKFLYTLGIFSFLVFQVFINIGMNIGVFPIAGITLPLISYGGSSLITFLLGIALL